MDEKKPNADEQTANEIDKKINNASSPELPPEDENSRPGHPGLETNEPVNSIHAPQYTQEKSQGSAFPIFFSFLISLASLFVAGYLFTESTQIKSQLKTAELEADFLNRRSEVFANDITLWKSSILKNMEMFDRRLLETESFLKNDIRERRDSELTKLLMGINQLSRLSDDSDKARIEEAAIILQGISTSQTESSFLEPNTQAIEEQTAVPVQSQQPTPPGVPEKSEASASPGMPGSGSAEAGEAGDEKAGSLETQQEAETDRMDNESP